MNDNKGLTIAAVILFLLLLGVGFWAFKLNRDKNELTVQNEQLTKEMGNLSTLRDKLEHDIDSLQQAYASLAEENQNLEGSIADAQKKIAEKEAIIKKVKVSSASESKNLKAQIEQLLAIKAELEGNIANLQSENDSLRMLTGQLTEDLSQARSENEALNNLNKTIQEEVKRLTLANFKASAFRVEVERKKPKATAKARRARRILVSFDLTGVPPQYRGVKTLYLVLTDDKGTPIKMDNPIQAKVTVNGQAMDIQAAKAQEVNIVENQRLQFNHELEDKLKSGYYRAAVYTDIGLLGASSFRLQ
jgi:DNA repair exonuclease SbcCD ATPase subunit